MQNFDFDRIRYHRYRDFANSFVITDLVGFDTEAYDNGKPFLYCDSNGQEYDFKDNFEGLFLDGARRIDYALWNLRYDAGAILYHLPFKIKACLAKDEKICFKSYRLEYLPHKLLRIKKGCMTRNFWDIMPFYKMSLDSAAGKYLGERKIRLRTKKFTKAFVVSHRKAIKAYCTKDARLTANLGRYLLRYLDRFKIHPRSLYSPASISFEYFKKRCEYIHVWRFWKKHRKLLRFACEAYFGGKFEVIARGRFTGYEYDISAAYGSEIANLWNVRYGTVHQSQKYEPKWSFGFYRVKIDNRQGRPVPCTYKKGNLNLYPAGTFRTTITQEEYKYLQRNKINCRVLEGIGLSLSEKARPYEREVRRLYKIKEQYKTTDPMVSHLAKTMINSFYGKFVQLTEENDGTLTAGMGWNPIYGAVITANMRIRLTALQAKYGRAVIGVHTDSILTTRKMPDSFLKPGLGNWTVKAHGEGIIIACGIFQCGDKNANRGYDLPKGVNWLGLLSKNRKRSTVDLVETRPLSWTGQVSRGHDKDINYFATVKKRLDLNCEKKRVWAEKTNAGKLLKGLEFSAPPIVMEG